MPGFRQMWRTNSIYSPALMGSVRADRHVDRLRRFWVAPGRERREVWDVTQSGYWHARSLDYTGSSLSRKIESLRTPGDVVFILFDAVPLVIATIETWFSLLKGGSPSPRVGDLLVERDPG